MNLADAMDFLKRNQPLPEDSQLDPEKIKKYDIIRKYFMDNPNPECIPLFLNSFGNGSGFGVYQLVEDVLLKYSSKQVIPHLIDALKSQYNGVKYWAVQIASSFPDPNLITPLKKLLDEPKSDLRYSVVVALSQINDKSIFGILKSAQEREKDSEIVDLIEEIIADLEH